MSPPTHDRRTPALAVAAVLASLGTVSSRAEAHRVGLSQGDYSISGQHARARLVFAASELTFVLPNLDGDGDGRLSSSELAGQTEVLRSKIVDRMTVMRGTEACKGSLESVTPTTEDGVVLLTRYACERGSGDVHADLRFLSELEKGHRHIARVAGVTGTSEIILYEGNTRLELGGVTLPGGRSPALEYVKLGIEHILKGADHLLFLLGVVLLPASLRSLLLAVTAFTLSHSLSLVFSTLGIVQVNGAWIEPLIALSVAYIGVENWFLKDASRRWRLTFAFGLVHGLGFASALRDIGIPSNRLPVALACFNVGVEVGQLFVVLAVWAIVRRLQQRSWYRPRVLGMASFALFLVGSVWCVERAGFFHERAAVARGEASPASPRANGAAETVRPTDTRPLPLITKLCQSLSELPRVRRAECNHARPGISLANQCARMLGASVSSGALSIVRTEVDRCLFDWNQRYEGCGFAAQPSLPELRSCAGVFAGNLGPEATCRSSLECAGGLHCDGVRPMASGHCRPAAGDGASCDLSVDPLLGYVHGAVGADRAECQGACVNNRCIGRGKEIARRPTADPKG